MKIVNGQTLGLTLLSAEAAWAEFSAWNPSFFTIQKFATTEEDVTKIKQGLLGGFLTTAITSLALRLAFGKKGTVPAIAHVSVGAGMGLFYLYILSRHTASPI